MGSRKKVSADSSLTDKKLKDLRERALDLLDEGVDYKTVAKRLGLKPMQVAAYAAHRTMGTYD